MMSHGSITLLMQMFQCREETHYSSGKIQDHTNSKQGDDFKVLILVDILE